MDIGHGDYVALGGHCYVLAPVYIPTCYVWKCGVWYLSGIDFFQSLKTLWLDAGHISSNLYTDFEKQMIQGRDHKCILSNGSKIVASPAGGQT